MPCGFCVLEILWIVVLVHTCFDLFIDWWMDGLIRWLMDWLPSMISPRPSNARCPWYWRRSRDTRSQRVRVWESTSPQRTNTARTSPGPFAASFLWRDGCSLHAASTSPKLPSVVGFHQVAANAGYQSFSRSSAFIKLHQNRLWHEVLGKFHCFLHFFTYSRHGRLAVP